MFFNRRVDTSASSSKTISGHKHCVHQCVWYEEYINLEEEKKEKGTKTALTETDNGVTVSHCSFQ